MVLGAILSRSKARENLFEINYVLKIKDLKWKTPNVVLLKLLMDKLKFTLNFSKPAVTFKFSQFSFSKTRRNFINLTT